jgi:hypothetical protein
MIEAPYIAGGALFSWQSDPQKVTVYKNKYIPFPP